MLAHARWLAKLAFSVGLLAWFLHRTDLGQLSLSFSRLTSGLLVGVQTLFFVVAAVGALKWKCLIPRYRIGRLYEVTLSSMFYAVVLPTQLAGDVFRAYRLGAGRNDAEAIAASVLVDKVNGLVGLLLLGLFGAATSLQPWPRVMIPAFGGMVGLVLVALFSVSIPGTMALARGIQRRFAPEHPRLGRLFGRLLAFFDAWRGFLGRPAAMFGSFVLGIVYQLLCVLIIILLADCFGIAVAWTEWLWIFALISLAVLLPVSVGGLGVREGTLVGTLGLLGIAPADALAVSLSIFGTQVVGAAVGGLLELAYAVRMGRGRA